MSIYKQVKEKVTITQIVSLTQEVDRNLTRCPFHNDTKASMILSDKYSTYKCLACGAKGDSLDFWSSTRHVSIGKAVEQINNKFRLGLEYTYEDDGTSKLVEEHRNALEKRHIDYLLSRGIERCSIDEFQIGAKGDNVVFPIYDINDKFVAFVERSIIGDYKGKSAPMNGVIGNMNKVRTRGGRVFLCEGFIDCIQAWQEGLNAVCAFGSSFSEKQLDTIARYFTEMVLAFDQDNIGRTHTILTYSSIKRIAPNKKIYFAEHTGKDIGEHLLTHDDIGVVDLADMVISGRIEAVEAVNLLYECGLNIERKLVLMKLASHYGMSIEELEHDIQNRPKH